MVTAQEVYDTFCFDIWEDPPTGLQLGLVTLAQFYDLLNSTILDFLTQTGIARSPYTQQSVSGTAQYTEPDDMLRTDLCFIAGRYLPQSTAQDLSAKNAGWRSAAAAFPKVWRSDQLPPKAFRLWPPPSFTGTGTVGDYSFLIGASTPSAHLGVTIVGPRGYSNITSLSDPIPLLLDDFTAYLIFGVHERLFGGENEMRDPQRCLWCRAQYLEGISLAKAIMGELDENED